MSMYSKDKGYCKRIYINGILDFERELKCNLSNCRGYHNESDFIKNKELKDFDKLDWSEIDIYDVYSKLGECLNSNKHIISKFSVLKDRLILKRIEDMSMIERLDLFADVCLKIGKMKNDSLDSLLKLLNVKDRKDIPKIEVTEYNSICWSLWKRLRVCNKFENFMECVKSGEDKFKLQNSLCYYDYNCKEGTHDYSKIISYDNLIYGSVDEKSEEDYEIDRERISVLIESNKIELCRLTRNRDPIIDKSNYNVKELLLKLRSLKVEYIKSYRKLHLTELGLVPLEVRIQEEIKRKEEEEEKEKEKNREEEEKKEMKVSVLIKRNFRGKFC